MMGFKPSRMGSVIDFGGEGHQTQAKSLLSRFAGGIAWLPLELGRRQA